MNSHETAKPPELPHVADATPSATKSQSGPWGFWATVGWGAIIGFGVLMLQGGILFSFAYIQSHVTGRSISATADLARNGLMISVVTLATAPFVVCLCCLFAWLRRDYPFANYLGLTLPRGKVVAVWIIGLVAYVLASDFLTLAMKRPIVPEFMIHAMETAVLPPFLCVAVIIAAPVSEEFFFRGFLLAGFQHSIGKWPAVVGTAGMWAIIHLQYDPYQIMWVFAAGVLLGLARITTGSLLLCIFLHSLMNLIATVEAVIYLARR